MLSIGPAAVTVIAGVIGLAMVAVIFSKNATTSQVISTGGTALASIIGAAVAPVAGNAASTAFGSAIGGLGAFA